ncbi:rim15, signal transduction response regulator, partial [Ascosphaera atra]
ESEAPSIKEPFVRGHHKRRSQLFDVSPSSSDNEDPRVKALLKVQRRRQSSRRLSQLNLDQGPFFRPLDVLICEDHPVSRIVMERLFEKLRCRTITAVNGSEAMRYALSEVQFDAILTEFKLPYINGYDVARMIRETKSVNTRTPIVAVTGYLKEFPETHDFDALIEKPPTLTKLSETLSRLCQWKPPPKDMDLLPAPLQSPALRHAVLQGEDPPSSASSSYPYGQCPSAFSRQDSVGSRSSYSYFTDLEPAKPENASGGGNEPTRRQADELSTASSTSGRGHPQHPLHAQTPDRLSTPSSGVLAPPSISRPSALHAPRISGSDTSAATNGGTLYKKPSISDLHSPRNLRKTLLCENTGAESGDDEDEELGDISGKASAKDKEARRPQRPGSKLGQMMRTNSQGSVVSSSDGSEHAESMRPQEDNPSTGPNESDGDKGLETSLEKLSIKDEKLTTLHEHEEQEDNMHSGRPNDRPESSSAASARDKEDDPAKDAQSTPTPSLQISGPVSPTREEDNHSHSSASSVKSAVAISTPPQAASRGPASQSSGGIIDKDKTPKASPMFTPPHDSPSDNDAQSDTEIEQTPKLSSMSTTSESRPSSNSQA